MKLATNILASLCSALTITDSGLLEINPLVSTLVLKISREEREGGQIPEARTARMFSHLPWLSETQVADCFVSVEFDEDDDCDLKFTVL